MNKRVSFLFLIVFAAACGGGGAPPVIAGEEPDGGDDPEIVRDFAATFERGPIPFAVEASVDDAAKLELRNAVIAGDDQYL